MDQIKAVLVLYMTILSNCFRDLFLKLIKKKVKVWTKRNFYCAIYSKLYINYAANPMQIELKFVKKFQHFKQNLCIWNMQNLFK